MDKFKHVRVSDKTHQQLKYLSLITNKKMSSIVAEIMENITQISVMHQKGCSFSVDYRVTESSITIVLHGKTNLVFGHSATDAQMQKDVAQAFEKAEKSNTEIFGDAEK